MPGIYAGHIFYISFDKQVFMNILKLSFFTICIAATIVSCSDNNKGHSTSIDSTNVNGTAPAVYAPNNPANDKDSNFVSDTGAKATNLHHEGHDSEINRSNASGNQ